MNEWKNCTLSEVIKLIGGGTPKTTISDYWNGNIPWLSVVDFNDDNRKVYKAEKHITELGLCNSSTKLLETNDIIVSARGTVGAIAQLGRPMAFNQSCYGIKNRENIDIDFLYYLLKTKINELKQKSHGSVFSTITRDTFDNIEIELPPLETQKQIAKILSSIDDKIELNNKINDNLEQQAQSIFKSWFVDFEPFGGVMPSDWETADLGAISKITSGKRPPMKQSEKTKDVNIPLVGAASMMGYTNAILYNEKILVTGRVGTHGVIQRFNYPCWTSDNSLVIKSDFYEFVYQVLKTIDYKNMNRGSTQPLITQTDLKNTEIILPSKLILNKFETLVASLMDKQESNKIQSQNLAQLRDTLLPRLMSGEIDVSQVEI